MIKSVRYELRYKTNGYAWKVFDTYKSKDCPELIKHHANYRKSPIIKEVEVVEIRTSREVIAL